MLCALHVEVVAAVEVAVADGFHDVVLADLDAAFEVGDGAGDFQDAVVGSRTHVHAVHGVATADNRHDRKGQKLSLLMTLNSEFG